MSTDNGEQSGSSSGMEAGPLPTGPEEEGEELEEEEEPTAPGRDCVVCQNAPVNRVLLPCRHTCVCDGCVTRFQHCPMCRAFVEESFALANQTHRGGAREEPAGFTTLWWSAVKRSKMNMISTCSEQHKTLKTYNGSQWQKHQSNTLSHSPPSATPVE